MTYNVFGGTLNPTLLLLHSVGQAAGHIVLGVTVICICSV